MRTPAVGHTTVTRCCVATELSKHHRFRQHLTTCGQDRIARQTPTRTSLSNHKLLSACGGRGTHREPEGGAHGKARELPRGDGIRARAREGYAAAATLRGLPREGRCGHKVKDATVEIGQCCRKFPRRNRNPQQYGVASAAHGPHRQTPISTPQGRSFGSGCPRPPLPQRRQTYR